MRRLLLRAPPLAALLVPLALPALADIPPPIRSTAPGSARFFSASEAPLSSAPGRLAAPSRPPPSPDASQVARSNAADDRAVPSGSLPRIPLPPRAADAESGSTFADRAASMGERERYAATRDQILAGNVPDFLRELAPVALPAPAGPAAGPSSVTVFVTRDYLAVGDDADFLTLPLDLPAAVQVAERLGCALPTTRVVDAVYAAAATRLAPIPLPPGPLMRSMAYILDHDARLEAARGDAPVGGIVAGTKKDLVLTPRLRSAPDREAIYGWHHLDGRPIQPLSLVHGVHYADYSHGVRLVADTVLVDGAPRGYFDALADPAVAPWLSREGAIPDAEALLTPHL